LPFVQNQLQVELNLLVSQVDQLHLKDGPYISSALKSCKASSPVVIPLAIPLRDSASSSGVKILELEFWMWNHSRGLVEGSPVGAGSNDPIH
jgi:hypothetical protein